MAFRPTGLSILLALLFLPAAMWAQTELLPLQHELDARIGRSLYNREKSRHTSIRPYELRDVADNGQIDSVLSSGRVIEKGEGGWLYRKLFSEHLLEVSTEDYRLYADFIPDFQVGRDVSGRRPVNLDTRGFAFGGSVTEKFSFTSEFYENQAQFPAYVDALLRTSRMVPGQAMWKTYGAQSFDYAYSNAVLSYRPSRYLGIQLGQGKNFIGDGYRSMLLSDASFNYPFLKLTADVWRIKYMSMWTEFQDLTDYKRHDNIPWKKKNGVFHYLDLNVTDRLSLGLFEAIIWLPQDSSSDRGFEWNYLNPIIFMRPVEFSLGSPDNVLMGLNVKYLVSDRTALYGQVLLDEMTINEYFTGSGYWGNKYGLQLGVKSFEPFDVKSLYLQTEFNCASPYTYSHRNPLKNYGHYNQGLAHPFGANFYESVSIAHYAMGRFELRAQMNIARFGADSGKANYGKDIYKSYDTRIRDYGVAIAQGVKNDLLYGDVKIAYILNPVTNLRFELGATYRRLHATAKTEEAMVVTVGLRSSFRNLYYDF